jgi:hypothetical protein
MVTASGQMPIRWVKRSIKAQNLSSDEILGDGAIVLRMSFQLNWIYAYAVKAGRPVRRRYRYGQDVMTEQTEVAGVRG